MTRRKTGVSMLDNNVTIMKYKATNGKYKFVVLDKFDESDETVRFDKMLALARELKANSELSEYLWIKNTPII